MLNQQLIDRITTRVAELKADGISEREICRRAGVGVATVQNIKKGREPGAVRFAKLLRVLGMSQDADAITRASRAQLGAGFDKNVWRSVIVKAETWQALKRAQIEPEAKADFLFALYDIEMNAEQPGTIEIDRYPNIIDLATRRRSSP